MEYHYHYTGDAVMCGEIGPLEILCWGKRLLLIIFFISFFVVYGYFHVPITYTFLGSIVCLIVPAYLYLDEEIKEIEGENTETNRES